MRFQKCQKNPVTAGGKVGVTVKTNLLLNKGLIKLYIAHKSQELPFFEVENYSFLPKFELKIPQKNVVTLKKG